MPADVPLHTPPPTPPQMPADCAMRVNLTPPAPKPIKLEPPVQTAPDAFSRSASAYDVPAADSVAPPQSPPAAEPSTPVDASASPSGSGGRPRSSRRRNARTVIRLSPPATPVSRSRCAALSRLPLLPPRSSCWHATLLFGLCTRYELTRSGVQARSDYGAWSAQGGRVQGRRHPLDLLLPGCHTPLPRRPL